MVGHASAHVENAKMQLAEYFSFPRALDPMAPSENVDVRACLAVCPTTRLHHLLNTTVTQQQTYLSEIVMEATEADILDANELVIGIVLGVEEALDKRFSGADMKIFTSLGSAMDFRVWPAQWKAGFAVDHIRVLANHYFSVFDTAPYVKPANMSPTGAVSEWALAVKFIYTAHPFEKPRSSADVVHRWQILLTNLEFTELFPATAFFANLYMIVPCSSVECERVFSHMNLVKNSKRNRMAVSTVDRNLLIKLDGKDPTHFYQTEDAKQCIDRWNTSKQRRRKRALPPVTGQNSAIAKKIRSKSILSWLPRKSDSQHGNIEGAETEDIPIGSSGSDNNELFSDSENI